jgi:hypothetical protein
LSPTPRTFTAGRIRLLGAAWLELECDRGCRRVAWRHDVRCPAGDCRPFLIPPLMGAAAPARLRFFRRCRAATTWSRCRRSSFVRFASCCMLLRRCIGQFERFLLADVVIAQDSDTVQMTILSRQGARNTFGGNLGHSASPSSAICSDPPCRH